MLNKLEILKREAEINDLELEVVPAPNGAVTFDQIAILLRKNNRFILEVIFYNSKDNAIVHRF